MRSESSPPATAISGARYAGVPPPLDCAASGRKASGSSDTARPQSPRYTSPKGPSSTLSGLMSRWSTRRECAKATASHTFTSTSSASTNGCPPARAWLHGVPSTRFITKKGAPSAVVASRCTGTMLGCSRRPVTMASRTRLAASPAPERRNFTATSRWSARCSAATTWPMPPVPSVGPSTKSAGAASAGPAETTGSDGAADAGASASSCAGTVGASPRLSVARPMRRTLAPGRHRRAGVSRSSRRARAARRGPGRPASRPQRGSRPPAPPSRPRRRRCSGPARRASVAAPCRR